ncbi:Acyltransferase 3 [Neofusicoccum parvum]|uniref:Acyltransferase 3 n=1 Tax=Neofusicoccum parvum TaxID=310453 RepID=A0ACB5SNF7_9PEZI|nr:Acyltransferase 3 [Neofusicoccum parvum]
MVISDRLRTNAATLALQSLTKRFLWTCVPSFLQSPLSAASTPAAPLTTARAAAARPGRTPYLDGLRGVAALCVVLCHMIWTYHGWIEYGWGDGPSNRRIIQLPPLRLAYAGHAMVSLFFVVGGYVSSARAIRLARSRQHEKVYLALTSSLFRRAIRLYAPALVATFVTMWTIRLGLWEPARQYVAMPYMFMPDNHHVRLPSLGEQLEDWWGHAMGLTNVWSYYNHSFWQPYYNPYDPHLWTVPMEMRGSLVVMLALLALLRCRVGWRFVLMALIVVFCVYWDRWECMEFVVGAMLAEGHMIVAEAGASPEDYGNTGQVDGQDLCRSRSNEGAETTDSLLEKPAWGVFTVSPLQVVTRWTSQGIRRCLRITLFVLALYVFSAPNHRYEFATGYGIFPYLVPRSISDPKRFIHGIGSALLIMSVSCTPALQRMFDHAVPQYLGKISYALYICHGPVIHMVGMYLTPTIWSVVGYETMTSWLFGFLVGSSVVIVVVFWAADLFWRVVDMRCVAFARWFEGICFEKSE